MELQLNNPKNFVDGSRVKLTCGGKTYSRKVFWDYQSHDLYIWFKGRKYWYMEFTADWKVTV